MNYFITGATGFIGRFVIEELLKQEANKIYILLRTGSEKKFEALLEKVQSNRNTLIPIFGDLTQPALGIAEIDLSLLKERGGIQHFFHLAAIYDMNASATAQELANIEGTRNALHAAEYMNAGCFHHMSSVAAGGLFKGTFTESMFEEAQGLDDPYFQTKHLSEKCVREQAKTPFRIYRPSMVVGHSETGEIDKIDGPYYIFTALELLGSLLPNRFPLIGLEGGMFNIVPVDYVAQAMVYIAHQAELDGQCFHLCDERHYPLGKLMNLISAQDENLPRFVWLIPATWSNKIPTKFIMALANFYPIRKLMEKMQIPTAAAKFISYPTQYNRSNCAQALQGSGIELPDFENYLPKLWQFWKQSLSLWRE